MKIFLACAAAALVAGGIAATFWLQGPKPDTGTDAARAGHERMVARLAAIDREARQDNHLLGDRKLQADRRRAQELDASVPASVRCMTLAKLGYDELRMGRERDAIARLTEAQELLPEASTDLRPDQVSWVTFHLGVAFLRLGETQNCCLRNTPDSCILPIQGGGVHTSPEGSRNAIRHFEDLLRRTTVDDPFHLRARWLLNVAYMTLAEHPEKVPPQWLIPADAYAAEEPVPRFHNIAKSLGLDTFSLCGGVIADDFDGDHDIDLMVSSYDTASQLQFFRNEGDGSFSERSAEAGLTGLFGGLNLVQADYDNDGDIDFLVLRGAWFSDTGRHPNSLVRNEGDGTFTDVTFDAGLAEPALPTQTASWADYDNDGDVDVYIGNESTQELRAPSQLYRNNGDGTFIDVAERAGVTNDAFAKAAIWGDYNSDGLPDLFVSNLGSPNRLYRNVGGRFADVAAELGVDKPLSTFPCWFFDYDNDRTLDLLVFEYGGDIAHTAASLLELPVSRDLPSLFRGQGDGSFQQVSAPVGLTKPVLPMGSNFGDIDGDGWLDFYLGTGTPEYMDLMPSVLYRNRGGKSFVDVTSGAGMGNLQKGHGIAFADFDNDGDQDVFAQMGGAVPGDRYHDALYENPGFGNHWLTLQLVGQSSNRAAIGAHIEVRILENGSERSIFRHVNSGGTFGANPLRQNIGLGRASKIVRVAIHWPVTTQTQTLRDVPLDRTVVITEGKNEFETLDLQPVTLRGSRS